MPLIPCYECAHEISEQAISCPHCGAPSKGKYPKPITVSVADVQIQFGTMIGLLVKAAIAAIPAAIFLLIIGAIVTSFFTGMMIK